MGSPCNIGHCRSIQHKEHTPTKRFVLLGTCLLASFPAAGQYQLHNIDVGVGIAGRFTAPLPSTQAQAFAPADPLVGPAVSLRVHSQSWLGVEINFQQSRLEQNNLQDVPASARTTEVSAAYLLHSHARYLQPYVAAGVAEISHLTDSSTAGKRAVGMLDLGIDFPLPNPHFGLSIQAHTLYYPVQKADGSQTWSTWYMDADPSARVYLRF